MVTARDSKEQQNHILDSRLGAITVSYSSFLVLTGMEKRRLKRVFFIIVYGDPLKAVKYFH